MNNDEFDIRKVNIKRSRFPYIFKLDMNWISIASQGGQSCITVGLLVWYRTAVQKENWVSLSTRLCSKYGISRDQKARALNRLRDMKLVSLTKKRGKPTQVHLIRNTGPDNSDLFTPLT